MMEDLKMAVTRHSYRDRIIQLLAQRSCKDGIPTSSQKRDPEHDFMLFVAPKKPRISHLNKSGPPATSSSSNRRNDEGGPAAKGPPPPSSTPFVQHHQRFDQIQGKCLSDNPVAQRSYRDRIVIKPGGQQSDDVCPERKRTTPINPANYIRKCLPYNPEDGVPTSSQKRKPEHDFIKPVAPKKPRISHVNKSGPPAASSSSDRRPVYHPAPSYSHHHQHPPSPRSNSPSTPEGRGTQELPLEQSSSCRDPSPTWSPLPSDRGLQDLSSTTVTPDYVAKYSPLMSMDQRQTYKDDFNAEYGKYHVLRARAESIGRRCTQLVSQCRKLTPGTKEYQRVHEEVKQHSPNFHEAKQRYEYLHNKLAHIKRLIADFDQCTTVMPDYVAKYSPLMSMDQRQTYKDDFNAEYDKCRVLHAHVESISRRCTQLVSQCRKLTPGTKEYQRVHEEVKQHSPKFHEAKQRYEYLHNKLAHIKRLIADFDQCTTVMPDYVAKYSPLMSVDQRQTYKDDFNAEYDKCRVLHAHVESISRRCTQLVSQCRKLTPGTKEYQRVHEEMKQHSPKFHEAKQRYEYLHNKLAHIKRLIADFDQRRAQLWAWTKDLDHSLEF